MLSHMHGDHWDRVAQNGLDRALLILTTPHATRRLAHRGFSQALALKTWQNHKIVKGAVTCTVTSLPGRHAPTPVDRLLPPVMGSMVEFSGDGATRRLYVSGASSTNSTKCRCISRPSTPACYIWAAPGCRLVAPLPFGLTVTMDGRQGAGAVELLDLPRVIPMHFDDYGVFARRGPTFLDDNEHRGLADRVIELKRDASVTL